MPETWKPCPCCDKKQPAHAVLQVTCGATGDVFHVRVPWEARHDASGWGDKPRVRWTTRGEEMHGYEDARGDRGITVVDAHGQRHQLHHGAYQGGGKGPQPVLPVPPGAGAARVRELRKGEASRELEELRKARALKTGQRWITVHPNGPDEKGVPVLIQQESDGSHRIIGGAGGKLTHLRLHGIKSEEEYAEQASGKAKERRDKEKERKAGQSKDDAGKEKKAKKDVEAAKKLAEREFIQRVRDRVGGVTSDLDDDKLRGLSDGARNLILSRHHKKQLTEATKQTDKMARKLVDERVSSTIESTAVLRAVEEDPVISEKARALAEEELHLRDEEDEARRAERREKSARVTGGDTRVGEKAAEKMIEHIEKLPDPGRVLERYGGRDDSKETGGKDSPLRLTLLPSEELERRAAQAMQDAQVLAKAAKGEAPTGKLAEAVVKRALEKAGVEDPTDEDAVRGALAREAALKAQRSEVVNARAKRMKEVEGSPDEGGEAAAEKMLAYSDMVSGIATSASAAKKLGLTEAERVPMQECEIADALDLLQNRQVLREKQREFQAMNKEAEAGEYDRSRRAFDLSVKPSAEAAQLSVEDEVRRELAERLVGMGSTKRSEHLQALGSGHYDGIADVGLGVAGQRYIDRPTVDAIGVGNAALLMRHAMEGDGHRPDKVLQALEEHHVDSLNRITADAIKKADSYVPGLSATVEDVGDIEKAIGQLDVHDQDIADAQRAVGAALGRMEATATLAQAFRKKVPDSMRIQTKDGNLQGALQWLHSVGLKPEDYSINYKEKHLEIPRSSWDKMVNRIPAEEVRKRQVANEIKGGKRDQPGYLPAGIVSRAASTFTAPKPDAPRYHVPLDLSGSDVRGALEDHVGSRLADGEPPHEILHDLLAPVNVGAAADPEAYTEHVRNMFPLLNEQGEARKYQEHAAHFQGLAEKFMQARHGSATGAFHAQDIGVDDKQTHEALFRALAEQPHAPAAFVPTGQLTPDHQRTLRDYFYTRMGYDPKDRTDSVALENAMRELGTEPDPNKGTQSLFGGGGPSPEWREWADKRDAVLKKYPREGLDEAIKAAKGDPEKIEAAKRAAAESVTPWQRYVDAHGSLELAQRALQDEIRGKFNERFADHYGKVTGKGLKVGVQDVTNRERHVKATAGPEEAERLKQDAQAAYAHLRKRIGGKFAGEGEGAVVQKYTRHLEEGAIAQQNQASMFGAQQLAPVAKTPTLEAGQRWGLGERAENQIGSLMGSIGAQFEPGKPVGIFPGLNMDGPRVHQQRVIRMLGANGGRLNAFLGTGSGKSLTSIGAFTEQHALGNAQHGLYIVPSAVQDQFGGEMLRYTEPGRYRWATGSGKSHDERVAMLKDPSLHMRVMTHQSFRDTAMKLMSDHFGRTEEEMKTDMQGASPSKRARWMREAFDAHGIPRHFTYLDEAHMATDRGQGDPSGINMVANAAAHPVNSTHYLGGTATPHKNDEAEVYSMAAMVDPDRYGDRHEFMQSYGQQLAFNPDAVRRELSHVTYSAKVDPEGVDRVDSDNPRIEGGGGMFGGPPRKVGHGGSLELTGEHKALVDNVQTMYERARKARDRGETDVEALRALSPRSFEGKPEAEHKEHAERLLRSLGVVKESAMRRAVNRAPPEINTKLQALGKVVKHDVEQGEWTDRSGNRNKGKPSIVFTDSLAEARMIHEHLQGQGIRAALYHGGLNAKEREDVRLGFQPEGGAAPKHDVVVATSAAEAGINMQRAKVIHHFDVPQTEKSHAQRSGRAYRQGQQGDVDVHNWHTDAEYEQAGLRRLRRKEGLAAVFQSPIGNLDETGIAGAYQRALSRQQEAREVA